jgi:type IV pilus assembly protein PilB
MVGETRDQETARMAVEASTTGHLVMTSMHTNSALETMFRLLDLGVERYAIANSLQGVLHPPILDFGGEQGGRRGQTHGHTPGKREATTALRSGRRAGKIRHCPTVPRARAESTHTTPVVGEKSPHHQK